MIARSIQSDVIASLRAFPSVGLFGPRQVGKTTLAKAVMQAWDGPVVYLDLEKADDLPKLADAGVFFSRHEDHLVVIDEAQRLPPVFPALRVSIDRCRRAGRFLILGSAAPALKRQASESLAGRIAYHELYPLSLKEVAAGQESSDALHRLWLRGGYPPSYLAGDDRISKQWREDFIQTHLERDLPQLGTTVPATTLRRFWTMLAHCHSQTWNASRLADSMGIDRKTARNYLDILTDTFMVRQILPAYVNVKKRLVKSPKVYLRDSGLLHRLLNIDDWQSLHSHPILGASWEGFCIEQILSAVPRGWDVGFYRTQAGAEMDLVIHPVAMQPPIAIEIKTSTAPKLTRGNWNAREDLAPRAMFVVYPGRDSYPMADGVETLGVHQIGRIAESV